MVDDFVTIEEPLELRVDGDTVAVTMRTPGDDALLALGFLYGEGLIHSVDDVASVAPCGKPGDAGYGNMINVASGPGVSIESERVLRSRRFEAISAACGVCGRQTVDDLIARLRPVSRTVRFTRAQLFAAMATLSQSQPTFAQTGGLHAAAAFDRDGALLATHEDVGRHNAVDKVVGALLRQKRDAALLCVSGRSSFEIVQKAAAARIECVAAVSAPSSLAIELATALDVTLIGFVREPRCNVYSHAHRIAL